MCSRSNTEACRHLFPGARPGLLRRRARGAPKTRSTRAAARRQRVGAAAGLAGAEHRRPARPGAPVTRARYAAPRWKRSQLAGAAGALGEDPDRSARRAARAGRCCTARGSAWKRSSGIWPEARRNAPERAVEHLLLGQRVHRPGREDRQQRPVERRRCGCDATITGPRAGTCSAPCTRTSHRRRTSRAAERPQRGAAAGAAGAASRRCAAASWCAARAVTRRLRRLRPARRPGRSTSSRVYGVVSMWTAPSAIASGAVGPAGVDPVAARAATAWVAATSEPPSSAARRAARAAGVGGQVDLHRRRPGPTTEPMSRPSTTMPPSPAITSRCSSSSRARTSGTALTGLTAPVTSSRADRDRRRRRRRR